MCYTCRCRTFILISTKEPFSIPYHHAPVPLAAPEARSMSPLHCRTSHRPSEPEQTTPNLIRSHPRALHQAGSAAALMPRSAQSTPIPPDVASLPKSGKNGTPPTLASNGLQPCPHRAPAIHGRDNTKSHFRQKRQRSRVLSPRKMHIISKNRPNRPLFLRQ
jgi:hypothetical protein